MASDFHQAQYESDLCPGCKARWNGQFAAFECGYPSSDGCFAGREDDLYHEERLASEQAAWKELVDEALAWSPGKRRPTQAECDVLDAWEFEVHEEEAPVCDPEVAAEIAGEDIPF